MEKIKNLNGYQKGILLLMIVMVLAFTVIYSIMTTRAGFAYRGEILAVREEDGSTLYSGEVQGQQACFTIFADKTVEFQYGDKIHDIYTVKKDPTAIPKDKEIAEYMTGIEIRQGEDIFFRGGIWEYRHEGIWDYNLYNEDGTPINSERETAVYAIKSDGSKEALTFTDIEPSAYNIIDLIAGPKLIHKGDWVMWFIAVLVCILNGISILFADELFRWQLSFRINNADYVEPSDWEMMGRYFSWTILAISALVLFVKGLLI